MVTVRAARPRRPRASEALAANPQHRGAGSFVWAAPLKAEDVERLIEPHHVIDEAETARRDEAGRAIGLLAINCWTGNRRTSCERYLNAARLPARAGAGSQDIVDRPAWRHRLPARMRDGILRTHRGGPSRGRLVVERAPGQAILRQLPKSSRIRRQPELASHGASSGSSWPAGTTTMGPKRLKNSSRYQIPIMAPFGLAASGCART